MKPAEVKDALYDSLGSVLDAHSFKLKKKEGGFSRVLGDCRQVISVPFFNYNPKFEFSLTVCLRLEPVEAVFDKVAQTDPKYLGMGHTILTQLSHFWPQAPRSFTVYSVEEICKAVESLQPVLTEKIVPFLDRTKDLPSLAGVLMSTPSLDSANQPYRAMHAVIVGFLNRPSDLRLLIDRHRPEVQSLPEDFRNKFEFLVRHLEGLQKAG